MTLKKTLLAVLVGLFALMYIFATVVILGGEDPITAGDYKVYCRAAALYPSPDMYDRADLDEQLYFRYSPLFAGVMAAAGCKSIAAWLFLGAAAFALGLVLLYRGGVFRLLRAWVATLGIANSTLVAVFTFLNVTLYLLAPGVGAALLIAAGASAWWIALAVLPALLTKPHWAVYFLGVIWVKPPRYIASVAAAILVVYAAVVGLSALLMPNGRELWQTYYQHLISGNTYYIPSLPTYQQGLHQWLIFLLGNRTWVHAIYWSLWGIILVNYAIQVRRIVKSDQTHKESRLLALTYLSGALLLPDMQELLLAFIPLGVVMSTQPASAWEKALRVLIWIIFIPLTLYAFTGAVANFLLPESSIWQKVLLFQTYTPAVLMLALLLLIAVSLSATRPIKPLAALNAGHML